MTDIQTLDTEPQQEAHPGRRTLLWPPWPPILIALAFTAVLITLTALIAHGATTERRSTFVDGFDRECTQVQRDDAIGLSCAPKPFESRLADGLRDASERAS
jgi:hypothetical protein